MFTYKSIEQAWSLYQASIKYSSFDADYKKLGEESLEYRMAESNENLAEEFTDFTIMMIRNFCYAVEPKSLDELKGYVQSMAETAEFKTERTLTRFKEGFYK